MKERKKRSKIWMMPIDEFKNVILSSKTYTQILKHFKMINKGGNFRTLKERIVKEGIDDSHIPKGSVVWYAHSANLIPLEQVLIKDSSYSRCSLKKRLLKNGMIENKCQVCGCNNEWNGKPLTLQLDHINGDSVDNRLCNLRMICPNCHSQTESYCGRSLRKKSIIKDKFWRHQPKLKSRKVERPDKQKLEEMIQTMSWLAIGREFKVSDNAVRKWAKSYGIEWKKRKYEKLPCSTIGSAIDSGSIGLPVRTRPGQPI